MERMSAVIKRRLEETYRYVEVITTTDDKFLEVRVYTDRYNYKYCILTCDDLDKPSSYYVNLVDFLMKNHKMSLYEASFDEVYIRNLIYGSDAFDCFYVDNDHLLYSDCSGDTVALDSIKNLYVDKVNNLIIVTEYSGERIIIGLDEGIIQLDEQNE